MKLIQKTLVATAVALSAPAFAAIAPGTTGNGDLFLVIYNEAAQVSYTQDLGVGINTFRSANDFNAAKTMTSFELAAVTNVAGSQFNAFVAAAGASSNWRWYLAGIDSAFGSANTPGNRGVLTTVQAGTDVANITQVNGEFNAVMAGMNSFIAATNQIGDDAMLGEDDTENGSAFGTVANGGYALSSAPVFLGNVGAGFARYNYDNAVGDGAQLLYTTRTGANPNLRVQKDLFDNSIGDSTLTFAATQGGNYALTFTTAVPEPGTYALLLSGLAMVGALARRRRQA